MTIKALVFDAYGTIYDVHSVYAKTEELCPGKGDLITQIWRLKQLEYTWLETSLQEYRDFTFLTHASLEFALRVVEIEPRKKSPNRCSINISTWILHGGRGRARQIEGSQSLQTSHLVKRQHTMLSALVRNSGLDVYLDATISVDGARKFKPHPDCYALVEKTLGLKNDEVMLYPPTASM